MVSYFGSSSILLLIHDRVAVSNIAFITFLALKNTPLGFLTGYAYEQLNILHQVVGYCTIIWSLLHAVVYIVAWSQTNSLPELLEKSQVMGIIAGFAMLVILATALILRRLRYEVFYIVHVLMFMLILIVISMHRPDLSRKTLVIVIFAASIWALDRIIRFLKICLFGVGNSAILAPLQCGGTRITLRRAPFGATPGSHCFLWIPGIRMAETHPFTVVSTSPFEFVVGACNGFTRDLHEFALKNPTRYLRASVDGPYGSAPDFTGATKVLFIAGGSGASFSLGVAVDFVRKLGDSKSTSIEIIWVIREPGKVAFVLYLH
jgi:predicted ferric reductase